MGDRSSAPELRRNAPPAPPAPKAVPSPREHRRVWVNGRELTDEEIERKLKDIRIEGLDDLGELKELKAWSEGKGPFTLTASGRGRLGVRVEKLTPEMGEALGVSGGKGVVVLQVYEDTPAQKAGLRAGDVILEVAGHTVTDREELSKELGRQEGRVDILLTRKGTQRTVQAELPARSRTYGWTMDPDTKSFSFGNPELHRTPWVYRYQTEQEERAKADAELREEMTQLKQELQELKQQLGEQQKAKVPPKPKASTTPKSPATPKK
jgi:ribosomal protein L29